ncbi:hypothetical protein ACFL6N_04065 [Thermodesulfobacteriota bacterium]
MTSNNRFPYKLVSILSVLIGSISLITFFAFVLGGPINIIDLELDSTGVLLTNTFLSIMFFVQHSLMVRDSVQSKIIKIIPRISFYAFHSIISGTILFWVIFLWQESPEIITSIPEPYVYLLRFLQFISISGLIWGVKSLSNFDPFGRKQISKFIKNQKEEQENQFVYRGPYNFIRHPFYFFHPYNDLGLPDNFGRQVIIYLPLDCLDSNRHDPGGKGSCEPDWR